MVSRRRVVERYKRFRLTILTAVVLVVSLLAYPVIPASQGIDPDDFRRRDVDVPSARVEVHFENPVAMSMFDGDKAEEFVNERFKTEITVDERGLSSYDEFAALDKQEDTVYVLYTNWKVTSWKDGHQYAGLAVPDFDVFFVAGHAAFKMVDGQYLVFAHELGHLLEGPAHSPYQGNLMSQPIDGDQLCKCDGDPYAKWAR